MSVRAHSLNRRESSSEFISNHSIAPTSGHLLVTLILFNPCHETPRRRCHDCIHFANYQNTYRTSVVFVAKPCRGSWVDSSVVMLVTLWIKFKVRRNCQKRALGLPFRWKYTNSIFVLAYPVQPPIFPWIIIIILTFAHFKIFPRHVFGVALQKKIKIRWELQVWIKSCSKCQFPERRGYGRA